MPVRPTTTQLLVVSAVVQVVLLLYANHVDSHPERFGGLRYTDVDWLVVSDGARLIFQSSGDGRNQAEGWLPNLINWRVGESVYRQTQKRG